MAASLDEILERIRQHPRLVITDDYEIVVEKTKTRAREFVGGRPSAEETRDLLWISLRVIHRKQPGRAAVAIASADSLPQLVESAFEAAKHTAPDPWFRFPIWKSPKAMATSMTDDPVPSSLFAEIEGLDPLLKERYSATEIETRLVRKTERWQLADKRRVFESRLSIPLEEGGKELADERAHTHPLTSIKAWGKMLQLRTFEQRQAEPLAATKGHSILLTPGAAAKLLRVVAPWFCGDRIQAGNGPLGLPRGERFCSPLVTIVDDGELAGGACAMPFDYEGVATQETILVDNGEHRGLLLDTYSATRENRLGTGNFLRRAGEPFPSVSPSHFFVRAGRQELADLVGRMSLGIVVEDWDGEVAPAADGTMRLIGRGWEVVGGRPTRPVVGNFISCRIIDVLSHIVGVGKDLTFAGPFGSPSILCEDLPLDL